MGVGSIIVPPAATGYVAAAYGATADVSEGANLVAETWSGRATVRAGATMNVKFVRLGDRWIRIRDRVWPLRDCGHDGSDGDRGWYPGQCWSTERWRCDHEWHLGSLLARR